jgi:hypothetical protein
MLCVFTVAENANEHIPVRARKSEGFGLRTSIKGFVRGMTKKHGGPARLLCKLLNRLLPGSTLFAVIVIIERSRLHPPPILLLLLLVRLTAGLAVPL